MQVRTGVYVRVSHNVMANRVRHAFNEVLGGNITTCVSVCICQHPNTIMNTHKV